MSPEISSHRSKSDLLRSPNISQNKSNLSSNFTRSRLTLSDRHAGSRSELCPPNRRNDIGKMRDNKKVDSGTARTHLLSSRSRGNLNKSKGTRIPYYDLGNIDYIAPNLNVETRSSK